MEEPNYKDAEEIIDLTKKPDLFIGIDPGFRNLGYFQCVRAYRSDGSAIMRIVRATIDLCETSDNLEDVAKEVKGVFDVWLPEKWAQHYNVTFLIENQYVKPGATQFLGIKLKIIEACFVSVALQRNFNVHCMNRTHVIAMLKKACNSDEKIDAKTATSLYLDKLCTFDSNWRKFTPHEKDAMSLVVCYLYETEKITKFVEK